MLNLKELIETTRVYYCLDCGKCTTSCPVAIRDENFSPRRLVAAGIFDPLDEILQQKFLWFCLTCNTCTQRCPSDVKFIDFVKGLRILGQKSYQSEKNMKCTHGGTIQTWIKIMTLPDLKQNRLNWINSDLKYTTKQGDYLYFTGCLPYYNAYFKYLNTDFTSIGNNTIKILNKLGITPVLLDNERCCGHDLLWSGYIDDFNKLKDLNIEFILNSNAKTIITTCPECTRTLKLDYKELNKIKVVHITQLIDEKIKNKEIQLNLPKEEISKIIYHDPCRLSQHLNIKDEPRQILGNIMEFNKEQCCGTSLWINCTRISKEIQRDRLKESQNKGASTLITACPKCQIHFKCASINEDKINLEIKDIVDFISKFI